MVKMKLAAAVCLALLIMLSAGSAGAGRDIRHSAVAQAVDIWIHTALSAPAPTPVPIPGIETAPQTTAQTAPVYVGEPAADAVNQSQEPAFEAESAQEAMYKPEIIAIPDIPSGAPAPAQVKSLPESGIVCLTFDDGYSEASVVEIIDCLRENEVHCTFFVIGACLKLYGDLWRQAVKDGHEIAYHTMRHRNLNRCSNAQIVRDINQWNETARSVLGAGYRIPKIARAPGGSANARVRRLFHCLKYTLIYWSSDTFTGVYKRGKSGAGPRVASYILSHTEAGSISLQHFNRYDAAAVSRYIGELKARFRLGTVSDALAAAKRHARRSEKTNG